MDASFGFGVAGGLDPTIVRAIAREAESFGFTTFWSNDTPSGDGLATLAEAAAVTSTIRLGVGVIPLDRQRPDRIVARIAELGIPPERLTLGLGSGGAAGGLAIVRAGTTVVRGATGARVVVGALGPRMTALAGEVADGALLSWLTRGQAERSTEITRLAARDAGRPEPWVYGYVRTALGPDARVRLDAEASRYAQFTAYAAHFERMGVRAIDTTVYGDEPGAVNAGLAVLATVLDEVVVRAITGAETVDDYLKLLHAVAPRSLPPPLLRSEAKF